MSAQRQVISLCVSQHPCRTVVNLYKCTIIQYNHISYIKLWSYTAVYVAPNHTSFSTCKLIIKSTVGAMLQLLSKQEKVKLRPTYLAFDQLIQQIASACEILIHHTLVQYKKYGLERSKLEPKAINHENLVKSDLLMCIFDYNLFIKV